MTERKKVDLVIKDTRIYTQDDSRKVLDGADIVVEKGKIIDVGAGAADGYEAERTFDGKGMAVFPGMQNLHVHIFQSLLKGLGSDKKLIPWLKEALFYTGPAMDPYLYGLASQIAAIEALKSGITTISDFSYTQHCRDFAHTEIETMEKFGIRNIFMDVYHDRGEDMGVPPSYIHPAETCIKRTEKLYDRYVKGGSHPLTSIWMGSSVPWGSSEGLYRAILEFSQETGTPYTTHLLESEEDNLYCLSAFGKPAVEALEDMGFLTDRCVAVHLVLLEEREMKIFSEHGVNGVYCPAANAYLGSGIPPMAKMLKKDINITMGTDGAASNNSGDMIESLKLGLLLQKGFYKDPEALKAQDMLDFVTVNSARAAHRPDLGSIEIGKTADLFVFDPRYARSWPDHDTLATLMYNSSQENIAATIVNGKIVYEKGHFSCGIEEAAVVEETGIAMEKFMKQFR